MRIGLFPMVADVLHTGHILAIKEAKENCDYLIVALHCNPNYKDPVQSIFERFIQLDSVKYIDKVIPYSDKDDMANILESVKYDVYFLGQDHFGVEFENKSLLLNLKKEIYYLQRSHKFSSTDLKNRLVAKEEPLCVKK